MGFGFCSGKVGGFGKGDAGTDSKEDSFGLISSINFDAGGMVSLV